MVQQAGLRFDELAKLLPPSQPSHTVWSNISKRIDAMDETAKSETENTASSLHNTASSLNEKVVEQLHRTLFFWRSLAAVSTACAVALAFYLSLLPEGNVTTIVIMTNDQDSTANWVLALKEDQSQLVVRPLIEQSLPPERDFQLWVKTTETAKVQPVGTISGANKTVLEISQEQAKSIQRAVLFGVSIEPEGGSPTGTTNHDAIVSRHSKLIYRLSCHEPSRPKPLAGWSIRLDRF